MSYTNGLDKPSDYFNTKLYTGNGSTNAITGVGFQPDWVWIKDRDNVRNHVLNDAVRGATKNIFSNTDGSETTDTSTLTAFNSDGFTLGNGTKVNGNNINFVSWNWLGANGTAANTDGSITSTVSANTTAGFSIVKYTSTGTTNSTIGHGLNATPTNVIIKCTSDAATSWISKMKGADGYVYLDQTYALTSNSTWLPTSSSTITLTNTWGAYNTNARTYIAYCFAEKQGYSKFGSYVGNGSTDGTFVYTGFKPAFVMVKRTDSTANWQILDNKRNTYNPWNTALFPDTTDPDTTDYSTDHLCNGFKLKVTTTSRNGSGATYIYMAFSSSPFTTSTGIPTTAV